MRPNFKIAQVLKSIWRTPLRNHTGDRRSRVPSNLFKFCFGNLNQKDPPWTPGTGQHRGLQSAHNKAHTGSYLVSIRVSGVALPPDHGYLESIRVSWSPGTYLLNEACITKLGTRQIIVSTRYLPSNFSSFSKRVLRVLMDGWMGHGYGHEQWTWTRIWIETWIWIWIRTWSTLPTHLVSFAALGLSLAVSLSRSRFARVAVAEWRPIMNARRRIASSLFYLRQTHPAPLTLTCMFSAQFWASFLCVIYVPVCVFFSFGGWFSLSCYV
jgi:hypothetical protein